MKLKIPVTLSQRLLMLPDPTGTLEPGEAFVSLSQVLCCCPGANECGVQGRCMIALRSIQAALAVAAGSRQGGDAAAATDAMSADAAAAAKAAKIQNELAKHIMEAHKKDTALLAPGGVARKARQARRRVKWKALRKSHNLSDRLNGLAALSPPPPEEDGAFRGQIAAIRPPSYHQGDVRVWKLKDVPKLRHHHDVIFLSTKGSITTDALGRAVVCPSTPAADAMSGGDYDGDKCFVTWDPRLLEGIAQHAFKPAGFAAAKVTSPCFTSPRLASPSLRLASSPSFPRAAWPRPASRMHVRAHRRAPLCTCACTMHATCRTHASTNTHRRPRALTHPCSRRHSSPETGTSPTCLIPPCMGETSRCESSSLSTRCVRAATSSC